MEEARLDRRLEQSLFPGGQPPQLRFGVLGDRDLERHRACIVNGGPSNGQEKTAPPRGLAAVLINA
jgi:hypothetical protein